MAQLKQLSAGSSQIIMMMFRDKNNAPIKADSVHVKGSIFTGSGKPFEFEVNKGVCTNCKIQNDMLLFNIVPLLGLGQMQVYTQTYLGDTKAITGTYISENQQKLGVEVVQKGTFLSDRQGESVRFLANSNIDDGFYLQSGTDGKPLFEVIVNFKEMVGMPFIPDELEKGATEFYE